MRKCELDRQFRSAGAPAPAPPRPPRRTPGRARMSEKSKDQHPIYTWLSHSDLNGWNDSAPGWNFYKYLVDENGKLIEIFPSKIKPLDSEIVDLLK